MRLRKIFLIIASFTLLLLAISGVLFRKQLGRFFRGITNRGNNMYRDDLCEGCAILFPDGISVHEGAYQKGGITPRKDLADLQELIDNGTLVEIKSCNRYLVEPMDASLPCLLPAGAQFIDRLANEYEKLCVQNTITYIPFRITSATRSIESVKRLMKRNGNAIENSVHLRGKTLDISYLTRKKDSLQKEMFIRALANLRNEGLCYVKYEENIKCLHITCR